MVRRKYSSRGCDGACNALGHHLKRTLRKTVSMACDVVGLRASSNRPVLAAIHSCSLLNHYISHTCIHKPLVLMLEANGTRPPEREYPLRSPNTKHRIAPPRDGTLCCCRAKIRSIPIFHHFCLVWSSTGTHTTLETVVCATGAALHRRRILPRVLFVFA